MSVDTVRVYQSSVNAVLIQRQKDGYELIERSNYSGYNPWTNKGIPMVSLMFRKESSVTKN